jgi:hypothetical protein
MHPIILHQVAKARIADLHRQAERDRMARTARLVRKAHSRHLVPGDLATVLVHRVHAVLAARSLRPPLTTQASAESHAVTSAQEDHQPSAPEGLRGPGNGSAQTYAPEPGVLCLSPGETDPRPPAPSRRYMGDRRSPSPSGHITPDTGDHR